MQPAPPDREVWGLTGKYCAGKNQAAEFLQRAGCLVIDVDKLGHRVLEESREALAARFGPAVIDSSGGVNRRALSGMVFGNPGALKDLEAIVHPGAIELTRRIIQENPDQTAVINAALLFTSDLHRQCRRVIWIDAPLFIRIGRALRRDRLGLGGVFLRILAQKKLTLKKWKKSADIYVIANSRKPADLEKQLRAFLDRFGDRKGTTSG
ncbi:MAG: dephospho-CoA kinase [Spirochaetales bacterium]|jgi:dephospho-CoA kinase|nr:dephospho-CoA kinase [Spirochaetales bacterium]